MSLVLPILATIVGIIALVVPHRAHG